MLKGGRRCSGGSWSVLRRVHLLLGGWGRWWLLLFLDPDLLAVFGFFRWWWQIWVAELLGCVIRFRVVLDVFQVLRDVVIQARLPMRPAMLWSFSGSVTYDRFTAVFWCFTAAVTAMESGFQIFALGLECDLGLNARFIPCTWAFWPF